jgi:hypothetical protein
LLNTSYFGLKIPSKSPVYLLSIEQNFYFVQLLVVLPIDVFNTPLYDIGVPRPLDFAV